MKTLPFGTAVKIRGIKDEDTDLNGRTGVLCPKHLHRSSTTRPECIFGEVGVRLDPILGVRFSNNIVNVLWSEISEIQKRSK